MIVITDANIIISALLKPNSIIASILKDERKFQFTAPDFLAEEIKNHWEKVVKGTIMDREELKKQWEYYKSRITFFDINKISNTNIDKAVSIVKNVDDYDFPFVALYLHTGHKIWTGDKKLIKGVEAKGYKIFVTTEELKQKMYHKTASRNK